MRVKIVKTAEELKNAVERLKREEAIGIDTETTSLDPYSGRLRLVQLAAPDVVFVVDLDQFNDIKQNEALDPLRALIASNSPVKIAHNAKFDAKWLLLHLNTKIGRLFDTKLASALLGNLKSNSLETVAAHYLKIDLDKTLQKSAWDKELSLAQIEYAARDAHILIPLRENLIKHLKRNELVECAKLEFECALATAQLELNGIFLDKELWLEQIAEAEALKNSLETSLSCLIAPLVSTNTLFNELPPINLNSSKQLIELLEKCGIRVKNTSTLTLQQYDHPIVKLIIEHRAAQKSISAFGENFLSFINQATGRIHPEFHQIGAPTGRFACSNPNIQQIPKAEKYRRCFRPEPNRSYVIADYSQIELRILAELSGDDNFITAFRSGQDLHRQTAAQIYNLPPEDVSAEQRAFAKRLNFGVVYGIGPRKFAQLTNIPIDDAKCLIKKYFTNYPKLKRWLDKSAFYASRLNRVRTMAGRIINLSGNSSEIERVARNAPVQGTSADITKTALGLLVRSLDQDEKLVNVIHDEIVVETPNHLAEQTKDKVIRAMQAAGEYFLKKVPVEVDAKIAQAWLK